MIPKRKFEDLDEEKNAVAAVMKKEAHWFRTKFVEYIHALLNDLKINDGQHAIKIIADIEFLFKGVVESSLVDGNLHFTNDIEFDISSKSIHENEILLNSTIELRSSVDVIRFLYGEKINRIEIYDVIDNINITRVAVYYHLDGYITVEGKFQDEPEGKCLQKKYNYTMWKKECYVYSGNFKSCLRDGRFLKIGYNEFIPTKEIFFFKDDVMTSDTIIKCNGSEYEANISPHNRHENNNFPYHMTSIKCIDDSLYIHYSKNIGKLIVDIDRDDREYMNASFSIVDGTITLVGLFISLKNKAPSKENDIAKGPTKESDSSDAEESDDEESDEDSECDKKITVQILNGSITVHFDAHTQPDTREQIYAVKTETKYPFINPIKKMGRLNDVHFRFSN